VARRSYRSSNRSPFNRFPSISFPSLFLSFPPPPENLLESATRVSQTAARSRNYSARPLKARHAATKAPCQVAVDYRVYYIAGARPGPYYVATHRWPDTINFEKCHEDRDDAPSAIFAHCEKGRERQRKRAGGPEGFGRLRKDRFVRRALESDFRKISIRKDAERRGETVDSRCHLKRK